MTDQQAAYAGLAMLSILCGVTYVAIAYILHRKRVNKMVSATIRRMYIAQAKDLVGSEDKPSPEFLRFILSALRKADYVNLPGTAYFVSKGNLKPGELEKIESFLARQPANITKGENESSSIIVWGNPPPELKEGEEAESYVPFCPQCDIPLLPSQRCPKCGRQWSPLG